MFWAGNKTLKVPMALHRANRERLVERLRARGTADGVVLLRGAQTMNRDDTDHEMFVRQESFFQWLFGVKEPDCFGSVDVKTGHSTLFIPRLPAEYAVWMGRIKQPEEFRDAYQVSEVRFVDELNKAWAHGTRLLLLEGKNTDSGATAVPASFEGIDQFERDTVTLFDHIVELRVVKTEAELEVMRYVASVSTEAHKKVMAAVRPGMLEYQAEALFRFHCHHDGGCREQAYSCICACGPNSAILHYGHAGAPNERVLQDGDAVLFDMGAEYHW
jgi:Xaa-Pro dipeptidase